MQFNFGNEQCDVNQSTIESSPLQTARRIIVRVSLSFIVLAIGVPASASGAGAGADIHPMKTFKHLIEIGQASWYGLQFQGRKTANGEDFDMNLMTCAHRSLPLGTWVKVTNLRNRKSVIVRVNDRGPFLEDRIIDLSYAAAKAVGIRGVSKVRLDTMHADDPELTQALLARVQIPMSLVPSVPSVLSR